MNNVLLLFPIQTLKIYLLDALWMCSLIFSVLNLFSLTLSLAVTQFCLLALSVCTHQLVNKNLWCSYVYVLLQTKCCCFCCCFFKRHKIHKVVILNYRIPYKKNKQKKLKPLMNIDQYEAKSYLFDTSSIVWCKWIYWRVFFRVNEIFCTVFF